MAAALMAARRGKLTPWCFMTSPSSLDGPHLHRLGVSIVPRACWAAASKYFQWGGGT